MITAGDLKHRFKVEVNRRTVDDQGGFNSEWEVLGYFWAKVDNKALKRTNTNGELIHTQDMTLHIRQKQRFYIWPMDSRDYRLTDKRGNMYQIVNFEQSNFALDFYAISVVQAGHTNEPFAPVDNPCAGATPSIQILDVAGEYDVYINNALIVSGGYIDIFGTLLTEQGIVFEESGVLTAYRDATITMRFERTDAATIAFDALGNPTASVAGNVLSFCLLANPIESQAILFKNDLVDVSAPDGQGFITLSPNADTCTISPNTGVLFIASNADAPSAQYRVAAGMNDANSNHLFLILQSPSTGILSNVSYSEGEARGLIAINDTLAETLPVGTVVTATLGETGVTVDYLDQSALALYAIGDELSQVFPFIGRVYQIGLTGGANYCEAVPMQVKI